MPYSLQRLKEKWEASIETGHWPSARAQGNAHGDDVALNSELLHFSPDFAPLFKHYQNEYNFATDRWQLIRLLEDRRWLACSRCLKLHMVASFPQRERKKRPEDRTCRLGDLAGVVELCPCIKLSFRGKMDLVDLLRTRQQTLTALATQVGASSLERFCWHSCVMNYGSSEMEIRVFPELDKTDMLKVKVEYRLTIEAGQLGKEESMIPLLGCAHRAVDLWLASLTTGDPQYYNLQVRINNQTTISTLKRVKGETVAHTLVPADGSWTPEQIRQALLANTLISMTGILGQMYTAFPEEGGYRRDTWNLLLECFQ
ncbi:hypothetical protein F9C07_9231 [Aspergillus flavus]|uniref:Uncharacterized protein n=1 Tax=Aspergillus flavus (strain ATCC 200026 / FGSC A1120 / IAM 13836 / NRRL 3357 / JCM 12722 / SRRC 167) TaxID=332952 RepID=A0A7U2QUI4_ASPFN|nr:hypothetical protein F9C07_9231 [Aspergillus flavus]